ncbi:LysR family transcriptional regulator, partial [Klebsiella pneumoniae]
VVRQWRAIIDFAITDTGLTQSSWTVLMQLHQLGDNVSVSELAVLPERLVRGQSGLVVVEPPLAVAGFEMLMLWHERWHRDPAHQWLRQFIVNSLEEQTC